MLLGAKMTVEGLLKLDDSQAAAHGLYRFQSLAAAQSFAERATKPHFVFLGDDNRFWAALGRIASALETAGYELAL